MSKPFDSATKRLVEADPLAWLRYAGLPGDAAQLIDADLSTVTSEADRILRVQSPDYLAHIELQSSYEEDMGARMLRYNALAYCRYKMPVQSVVVLLRKEADGAAMSGRVGYAVPHSPDGALEMRYRVLRVWEREVEEILQGALATLPLAPLSNVSESELAGVVRRMEERIDHDAPPQDKAMLWMTTFLLMGLKYEPSFTRQLLKGVLGMKESSTYQYILEEGATEEARRLVLRLGSKRFGAPDAPTQAALEATTSLERLEQLADRILEVESWQELLK